MHQARWLIAAALLVGLAVHAQGCRKFIPKPMVDAGLIGSTGGGGGVGGRGGTGGETGGAQTSDANGLDTQDADRPLDGQAPDSEPPCGTMRDSPCCPGNRCGGGCCYLGTCLAVGDRCPERNELSCFSASCGGDCGGLLQKCCGDAGYCTAALTNCIRTDAGSRCESCGNTGEPCCRDNYCEPPMRRCVNGRCAAM
jgi:hypothetical protein